MCSNSLDVLPTFEFRLVSVSGYLDHSRAMLLGPRVREGEIGYNLVVPMKRDEGGGEVLVDRGFVSEKSLIIDEKNPDDRRLRDDEAIKVSSVCEGFSAKRSRTHVHIDPRAIPTTAIRSRHCHSTTSTHSASEHVHSGKSAGEKPMVPC